ncbi:hypothetical protein BST81_02235 [Leptolyngbya sp. 'hensonii']|uniref:GIY-YIG nuclease family protein n=1 Tax=Leptolyngbya sp. 'hensonii' TaxID=1922337 RepID=UPI000950305B|nr:GIY-YIG nuclease family protein [Leptolyngbya sp. 'hensonii']OLP20078.1 hypothetical protein BST81_02235 [Leptolyngbya sp. 'hensonii']
MDSFQYVYLLQELDFDGLSPTGLYKIGKTIKDVESRKRQYQAGNARFLKTHHYILVQDAQVIETALHRQLTAYRITNIGGGDEWFKFTAEELAYVIALMNEYNEVPVYRLPISNFSPSPSNNSSVGLVIGILLVIGAFFWILPWHSISPPAGPSTQQRPGKTITQSTSTHKPPLAQGILAKIEVPQLDGIRTVASLRSIPKFGDEFIIGSLQSGDRVTAYEFSSDGRWRRVKLTDGRSGWVASNFVR